MRETFACPHCKSRFGDPVWRDNHATVCAREKVALSPLPLKDPAVPRRVDPSPALLTVVVDRAHSSRWQGNVRLLPKHEADVLARFFALNPELPRQP